MYKQKTNNQAGIDNVVLASSRQCSEKTFHLRICRSPFFSSPWQALDRQGDVWFLKGSGIEGAFLYALFVVKWSTVSSLTHGYWSGKKEKKGIIHPLQHTCIYRINTGVDKTITGKMWKEFLCKMSVPLFHCWIISHTQEVPSDSLRWPLTSCWSAPYHSVEKDFKRWFVSARKKEALLLLFFTKSVVKAIFFVQSNVPIVK